MNSAHPTSGEPSRGAEWFPLQFRLAGFLTSACSLVVLAGCGEASPPQPASRAEALSDRGYSISGTPVLDLAGTEGDRARFLNLTAAASLRHGSLAVVDGFGEKVVLLDSARGSPRNFGSPGSGPGEFRMPQWVGECRPDSLFVWDAMTSRISVVDTLGQFGPQFSLPSRPYLLSCNAEGVAFILADATPGGSSDNSIPKGTTLVVTWGGDTLGTLGSLPTMGTTLLGVASSGAIGSEWIAFGSAESDRIDIYSFSGKKLRDYSTGTEARAVGEQHIEKAIDARMDQIARSDKDSLIRVMLRKGPIAKKLPYFDRLFVDEEDRVWVVTSFPGDGFTELRVFSDETSPPAVLRIKYDMTVLDIRHGRLLGRQVGSDGVPHLLVFTTGSPTQ